MSTTSIRFLLPFGALLFIGFCANYISRLNTKPRGESPSEAGAAFEQWGAARLFPDGIFHTENYTRAFAQMQALAHLRDDRSPQWTPIGPKNIGGRTLCLAVNPLDTNILWMGSASGGLWKSSTGGRGASAWERVETGFPLLGVSSIALAPDNPEVIYLGTGEVYNLENSIPNVAIRTTRGTYGIGILKSTDGGLNWQKSLDWSYGQLRGVQDIKINPLRAATVYAATTEGLLRSYDAGQTWQNIHPVAMAADIELNPVDTNIVFVTHGSLDDEAISGIYRSQNGGNSFEKLTNGLPAAYGGKTLLGLAPGQPDIMYASVANAESQIGLYKSTDGGDSWVLANSEDVCLHQGWYSHDVAVKPDDPNTLMWVGFDGWRSADGGTTVQQTSNWWQWTFGYVPAGGPEGPPTYVHADIHRAYYSPADPNKIYLVTDGGLFVSSDGGNNWEGRNGGYQTQQFYANVGNSTTNPDWCIGGMQDNATAIYNGDPSWTRVLGGDGLSAAIRPDNDQIMYGSVQYLSLYRSQNGGLTFDFIAGDINEDACFNGPFELAPGNPDILYAGAQSLWRSDNAGDSWSNASGGFVDGGNAILTIAVNPQDADDVLFSTAPTASMEAHVFHYKNGMTTQLQGLPNRYCMDLAWQPGDPNKIFAVFGGFNSAHLFRSNDQGATWAASDAGLPDVPANCLVIDPENPDILYLGNDLGVWISTDGGSNWTSYSGGAPQAMQVMHLSITSNRKLRVATHGLGMWQTDLYEMSSAPEAAVGLQMHSIFPNPAHETATVQFSLQRETLVGLALCDANGRLLRTPARERLRAGQYARTLSLEGLPAGIYGVVITAGDKRFGQIIVKK